MRISHVVDTESYLLSYQAIYLGRPILPCLYLVFCLT